MYSFASNIRFWCMMLSTMGRNIVYHSIPPGRLYELAFSALSPMLGFCSHSRRQVHYWTLWVADPLAYYTVKSQFFGIKF